MEIARQIAKGALQIELAPHEEEPDHEYARRFQLVEQQYPAIRFKPSDVAKYGQGTGKKTYSLSDLLMWPASPQEEFARRWAERDGEPWLGIVSDETSLFDENKDVDSAAPDVTLHEAMRAYVSWIEEHYFRPNLNRITNTGRRMRRYSPR